MHPALGGSAIGQLETMTGTKIDRSHTKSTAPSFGEQMAATMMESFLQGLMSSAFGNDAARQAELERQRLEAERLAEIERQRKLEHARSERSRWDAESRESSTRRRSMLGDPSASSDVVSDILGDPDVVDLRGSKTLTPKLLREPEEKTTGTPITETPAANPLGGQLEEFKNMVAQNRDPAQLNTLLEDLRSQLSIETSRMKRMLDHQQFSVREIEDAGAQIQQASDNALERGVSLAADWMVDMSTDKLHATITKSLEAGTRTIESTQAASAVYAAGKAVPPTVDAAEMLKGETVGDRLAAMYNVAEASGFFEDVADNALKRYKDYLKYGKAIVDSAVDVTTEIVNMRRIAQHEASLEAYNQAFARMEPRVRTLVEKINITREAIAAADGYRKP